MGCVRGRLSLFAFFKVFFFLLSKKESLIMETIVNSSLEFCDDKNVKLYGIKLQHLFPLFFLTRLFNRVFKWVFLRSRAATRAKTLIFKSIFCEEEKTYLIILNTYTNQTHKKFLFFYHCLQERYTF